MSWICKNCEAENPDTLDICEVCDSPAPCVSDIIGLWDFHYNGAKEMKLEIRRDGYALASSGTKYQWNYENREFELYIDNAVSYRGKLFRNTIKGVAYSIYKPLGWDWYATKRNDGLTVENLESGIWIIENDVSDLEDNYIRFLPNNKIESSLYGEGKWSLNDEKLEIFTANDFIRYVASSSKGLITGIGRNKISNEWTFKLIKHK